MDMEGTAVAEEVAVEATTANRQAHPTEAAAAAATGTSQVS